jgi:uncharacterized membrane protein
MSTKGLGVHGRALTSTAGPRSSEVVRVIKIKTGKDAATRKMRQNLPVEKIGASMTNLLNTVRKRTAHVVGSTAGGLAKRLSSGNESSAPKMAASGAEALAEGKSPLKAGVRAGMAGMKEKAKGAGGAGEDKSSAGAEGGPKAVNITEKIDVGLPVRAVYNQWTQFEDFPDFTHKLESVEQESDEKVNWRAQILFSHRDWESTIIEQIPDQRIVWHSKGSKGYVDGVVTFHELAPSLTRVLLVAEYHPEGFFEKTANLWRAQGRRLRLELKHIQRHMMTQTLLSQDEIEGWRGEIRDGEVVRTHDQAIKQEDKAGQPEKETGPQRGNDS